MIRKILLSILLTLCLVSPLMAAGTVSCTSSPVLLSPGHDSFVVTCTGVGDASLGTFPTINLFQTSGIATGGYVLIYAVSEIGTTAPNALTVKLYDYTDYLYHTTNAADYLGGSGVSVSASTSTRIMPIINTTTLQVGPVYVGDNVTLALTGNTTGSANVSVLMYFWRP